MQAEQAASGLAEARVLEAKGRGHREAGHAMSA